MQLEGQYKVNLTQFEGPLDLLLYLVRKNDLNIYEIPIAFITEEYLKSLEEVRELDVNVAGDFLQMAAELILFKSRMLLPQEGTEEEEGPDPQAELARRLLLYQKFKTAAQLLSQRWMLGREIFKRGVPKIADETENEIPIQGEIYQLMQAFSKVLARLPKEVYHEVARDRISISDRIYQLVTQFSEKKVLTLEELWPDPLTRYDIVITFLALLEMTRLKMIKVHQDEIFGTMLIRWAVEMGEGATQVPIDDNESN